MSNREISQQLSFGVEVFPVKIFRLLTRGSDRVLRGREVVSSICLQNSSERKKGSLAGYLWRTFLDFLIAEKGTTFEDCSLQWKNSGMVFRGECWTQNTLEHPKDVEESILSQVIETSVPLRYFLNREQLQSLIKRADSGNIPMPPDLREKIELQITTLSNMPELDAALQRAHRQKDIEMMEKHILATPEEAPMLYVRRMTPLEYERLQGFPEDWTQSDGQL